MLFDLLQKQPSYNVAEKIISTLSDKTEDVLYNKLAPDIEDIVAAAIDKALRNKVLSASNIVSEEIKEDKTENNSNEWDISDFSLINFSQNKDYNE